jgi:hypothetical protein
MNISCHECYGSGCVPAHATSCWGNCENHGCPVQEQCMRCRGSGKLEVETLGDPDEGITVPVEGEESPF